LRKSSHDGQRTNTDTVDSSNCSSTPAVPRRSLNGMTAARWEYRKRLSPRDRAVLQTIEKSAESVARGFAKIVEKGQGMAIGLTNHGTELRMRPENVCFACRSFIGTDIHYRELNST